MIGGTRANGRREGQTRERLLRITLIVFGIGLFSVIGLLAVVWAVTPIPDSTQPKATAQGSVIYYRDGKTVLAKQGVNRKSVPLQKVPETLRNAVIAAENRSFYERQGVSVKGTCRAVWSTVTGQQLQGGSTITQQLVRNYYSGLSQERSVVRKLKEIMISLKVTSRSPRTGSWSSISTRSTSAAAPTASRPPRRRLLPQGRRQADPRRGRLPRRGDPAAAPRSPTPRAPTSTRPRHAGSP